MIDAGLIAGTSGVAIAAGRFTLIIRTNFSAGAFGIADTAGFDALIFVTDETAGAIGIADTVWIDAGIADANLIGGAVFTRIIHILACVVDTNLAAGAIAGACGPLGARRCIFAANTGCADHGKTRNCECYPGLMHHTPPR